MRLYMVFISPVVAHSEKAQPPHGASRPESHAHNSEGVPPIVLPSPIILAPYRHANFSHIANPQSRCASHFVWLYLKRYPDTYVETCISSSLTTSASTIFRGLCSRAFKGRSRSSSHKAPLESRVSHMMLKTLPSRGISQIRGKAPPRRLPPEQPRSQVLHGVSLDWQ